MNHSALIGQEQEKPLTHRQQLAIAEILASPSLEEARRRVKAAKGTFYGWLKEQTFQGELTRQRQAVVDEAFNRLKAGLTQAVEKLLALLQAEEQPSIQLRAAQALLDHGIKAVELQDLERRLEALASHISNQGGNRWR